MCSILQFYDLPILSIFCRQLLDVQSLIIKIIYQFSPFYRFCTNQNSKLLPHLYTSTYTFLVQTYFNQLNISQASKIPLKLFQTRIKLAWLISLLQNFFWPGFPAKYVMLFLSEMLTRKDQNFRDRGFLLSIFFFCAGWYKVTQSYLIQLNLISKGNRRVVSTSYSLLLMTIAQHISLVITPKKLYNYNKSKMSIKSSVRSIKNILQDAVIRIPYFTSTLKPTSTIAALCTKQDQSNGRDNFQQILQIIKMHKGVIGFQNKLYYEKENIWRTLIIQFQDVDTSQKFYMKYGKNYDKSLININQASDSQSTYKFILYFCKDISSSGINMEDILYNLGRFCVQIPQSLLIRNLIKQVAKLVVVEGIRAEQELQKCKNLILPSSSLNLLNFMNPKYLSSEAIYYRWRVYSYLQGDGDKNYRLQPFQMSIGGPIYYPPDEQCQKYNFRVLNHHQRQYVTKLLESLSSRKYHIEEAMSFCISNEGSAIQICCIIGICIVESCMKLSSEQEAKVNRLNEAKHLTAFFYLISDILFNSKSTIYRDIFTVLLPPLIQRIPRISEVNQKIVQIVQIWSKKFLLQDQFLRGISLSAKRQLPSMLVLGMKQMTRSQHECYKDLIKIQTPEEIQQLCWKYGIEFSNEKIAESFRNLAAILSFDKKQSISQMEPQAGPYDGQALNQKDIQKIRAKACRVVSCQEIPTKNLWQKDKQNKSISND